MSKAEESITISKPEKVKVPKEKKPTVSKKDTEIVAATRKPREYELYCIWKALPPMMLAPVSGTTNDVIEKLRIEDPTILELIKLRTQIDFGKHFDVNINTLTDWNKLVARRDTLVDIRKWARVLTKNVLFSMYNNAMSKGGTSFKDRENYLKVIEQWSDKLDVKHDVGDTLADILRASLAKHGKNTDTKHNA